MAKRLQGCCLGFFMGIFVVLGGIVAGVYFGGNYAINHYLGDNGQLMALGIHNWQEAYDFIQVFGKEPDMSNVIHQESAPSEESKKSAMEKLEKFGFPMVLDQDGNPTDQLDIGKILSGGFKLNTAEITQIDVTGAELASIMNEALASGATSSMNFSGMKVEQVHFELDSAIPAEKALMTVTLSIPLDAVSGQLGPAAMFIKASKIYMTCTNSLTVIKGETLDPSAPGKDKLKSGIVGSGGIKVNDMNDQMSNNIISAFLNVLNGQSGGEAYTPATFNEKLGNMVADAVNNFEGGKSFVAHADENSANPPAVRLVITSEVPAEEIPEEETPADETPAEEGQEPVEEEIIAE